MSILDNLPKIFNNALGGTVFYDAVLTRTGDGGGPAYAPGDGATKSYPCKALVTSWSNYSMGAGLVAVRDRKVLILGASLAIEPIEGDDITVRRPGKLETLRLTSENGSAPAVKRDPSTSLWTCRGR